jgi:hypothetical protein
VSEQSDSAASARADRIEGLPETGLSEEQKSSNAARNDQAQAESIANAKEIALALHSYHGNNGYFPPAASYDKDDRPLLSWRVHIQPDMGQDALYRRFKLDEPWDSEHNRTLISQMPKLYADPADALAVKDGKTIYVAPVGDRTVFAAKEGTHIAKITDGTVNTVMVVTLTSESAVVWYKPADCNFLAEDPAKGLLDGDRVESLAAYADCTVHAISAKIDPADLRRLMQKDDREPLSQQY